MDHQIDARGLVCPRPVIETKKILDTLTEGNIITIVDNEAAVENVTRLAKSMGYEVEVEDMQGDFHVHMYKGLQKEILPVATATKSDMAILIGSEFMGEGSEELGSILMKGYMYTLTESKPYPKAMLFINSGVKLTTQGSEVLDYLKFLEGEGVEILSCGTCLDYYELKNKRMVGGVGNMYAIVETMNQAKNTVKI